MPRNGGALVFECGASTGRVLAHRRWVALSIWVDTNGLHVAQRNKGLVLDLGNCIPPEEMSTRCSCIAEEALAEAYEWTGDWTGR